MTDTQIATKLRELYTAAERAQQESPDIMLRPLHDYSSRPLQERPEAGFSMWIPADDTGAYAGVRIIPSEQGVVTHGQAGVRRSDGDSLLFSWPSLEIRGSGFVIDGQYTDTPGEAVHRLIRSLRDRLATARLL